MVVAIAVWSVAVAPGEPVPVVPPGDVRITNIALGEALADESARTTVKLMYRTPGASEESDEEEDEEDEAEDVEIETTVLCSLIPSKIEQTSVDVVLEGDEEYLIQAVGPNTVFLTGNYIDQTPTDQIPFNDESDDEGEYDIDGLDEDELDDEDDEDEDMEEDASRFEEVHAETAKVEVGKKEASKKRPRDADVSAAEEENPSKAEKKLNKKLKGEDGKAIPAGAEQQPKANGEAKKDKKQKEAEKEKKAEKGAEKKKDKGETREIEGVKISDHKVGTGRQAKAGDTVSMRYVGKLSDGKVFDQNKSGAAFKFRLGAGEVIKGWDVGVPGMQVGGERLIVVPPQMGYGKRKMGTIPPNSTLTFEVRLIQIQ